MNMISQGDIWLIEFDPSVGNEIKKTRPAVVINDNRMGRLGLYIVIPITQWKDFFIDYAWIHKVEPTKSNGLSKTSAFECFQIKSFSKQRFIKKIGTISLEEISIIHQTVVKTFDITYNLQK